VFQELVFSKEIFLIGKAKEIEGNSLTSYRDRAQGQSEKDRVKSQFLEYDWYKYELSKVRLVWLGRYLLVVKMSWTI